jgi:short-chain fatty acids transporter
MDKRQNISTHAVTLSPRRGVVTGLVYMFEQVMPDPFVLSICLTLFVILLSVGLAPHATLPEILTAWYGGTFNIFGFALQMILILATGYAIADAPLIQRGLRAMAAGVQTPTKAALVVFPIVAIASWLNWGLGLVVGALLAREIAKRVKVDFAWLVAGSYSAWSVCNSGLSSSIALSQASHGNVLNLVEKATGTGTAGPRRAQSGRRRRRRAGRRSWRRSSPAPVSRVPAPSRSHGNRACAR